MAFRQRPDDDVEEVDPISVGPHLLSRRYRSVELFGGHPRMPSHGRTMRELAEVLSGVGDGARALAERMVSEILEAMELLEEGLALFDWYRRAPGDAFLASGFDREGGFVVALSAEEEVASLLAAGEDAAGSGTGVLLLEIGRAAWLRQPGEPDGPGGAGEAVRPLLAQALLTAHAEIRKRIEVSRILHVVTEPVLLTDPDGEVWFGTDEPAKLAARREEQLVHERAAAGTGHRAAPAPEAIRPSGG